MNQARRRAGGAGITVPPEKLRRDEGLARGDAHGGEQNDQTDQLVNER
jgi:hypothetical protein